MPAPSLDVAIALAAMAGLAVLLVFVGLHLVAHKDVELAERLGRWGGAAPMRHGARESGHR